MTTADTPSFDAARVDPPHSPSVTRARLFRGVALGAAGAFAAFLVMAHDARLALGVPLGALAVLASTLGALDALGAFADASTRSVASVRARDLAVPFARALAAALAVLFSLWVAVHAVVPQIVAGVLLTAAFVALVAAIFALGVALGPLRVDENGEARSLLRRHGFWLLAAMSLLYLPTLGFGSLTDPWETHYGEAAREVLARDDWISLWWSWEGFFYSKPVLGIWAQAIMMATLGVHPEPDRMLEGAFGGIAHPEWAVRVPFTLFAMVGAYLLYKGVSRWVGRRAAMLGAIALATSPQWFLVAHQSMTDMPFVASLAAAVGVVLLAVRADGASLAPSYEVQAKGRSFRFDLRHWVIGAALLCVLPQILYLVSRNVELVLHAAGPHGFRPHLDVVHAGSGLGNCNQAGDPVCSQKAPVARFEPWMQASAWAGLLAAFVAMVWREQRAKRLFYLAAWFLAALSTMTKGPAGLVIPAACVFAWLCATRRWSELPQIALGPGLLIVALVVGPWFVAVLVRHGSPFTDELIFHDMYNRAFDHVHDTNVGGDTSFVYYLRELGYALFPWTALAPLGLFAWSRREARGAKGDDAVVLLFLWFLIAFALFTAMGTKFHHYILPAVPPAAMLAGIALDAFLTEREDDPHARSMLGAAAIAGVLVVALVTRDLVASEGGRVDGPALFMRLFTYRYDRPWPPSLDLRAPIVCIAVLAAVALAGLALPRVRRAAVGMWVAVALAWGAWGLDVYFPKASMHWGQRALMDAYYTHRASADEQIVAYQLNWKGENFYTGNRLPQFGTPSPPPGMPTLPNWVAEQRKKGTRVLYFATEPSRVGGLRSEIKPAEMHEVTSRADCNQFVLVRAVL